MFVGKLKPRPQSRAANSQERRGCEPRGHRLHRLPLVLVDEAQEVLFSAGALVLPEDAVLAAEETE